MAQIDYDALRKLNTMWLSRIAQGEADKTLITQAASEILKQDPESVYEYLNERMLSTSDIEEKHLGQLRQITNYPDFLRAASYLSDLSLGRAAYDWFMGRPLDEITMKRLGIRHEIKNTDHALVALQFLSAICAQACVVSSLC